MKPDIDLLLAKYFGGEASAEELAMLDDWLALSAENEVYFDELTKVYEKSGMAPPLVVNEDKALDLFEKHIHSNQKIIHKRSVLYNPLFYVAASITLLIGIFSAILFNNSNKQITITTKQYFTLSGASHPNYPILTIFTALIRPHRHTQREIGRAHV